MANELDTDPLLSIHAAQAAMADRISRGGWGYDLIYSTLVAGLVAGWSLPVPIALGIEAVALSGLVLLARDWANRNGVWLSGITPPRARWVAILLGLVIAALMGASIAISLGGIIVPAPVKTFMPLGAGLIAFGLALYASRLWRQVYRREMGLTK